MPDWSYTALERSGQVTSGTLAAADEAGVVDLLRRAGAVPLEIKPARGALLAGLTSRKADVLTRRDLSQMLRELATMLGAGQDLDRALRFLVETAPSPRVRRVLTTLRDSVRDGSPLATAMAAHPRSFPRLAVGLVRAGEAGGALASALERLAVLMERQQALSATIQSALIYPSMLAAAATGAVVLLLTQVLPQFVPLFEQSGAALPPSTRFLVDAGDALGQYGLIGLLAVLLLAVAAHLVLRRPAAALAFDRFKLRLPIVGALLREVLAARLCRTLGTLLQNGVALVPALGVARDVLGNAAGAAALDQATEAAKGGAGLSGTLAQSGLFPTRTVHLIRLGEETAQLATICLRAAEIHEEAVRVSTQRLVALLTPAITILMGAVIAGIVSSLLLAMLSLNDLAQ
jgi:general secretion pathway protein F